MKGNALKILIIEIICILCSMVFNVLNIVIEPYIIAGFLAVLLGATIFLIGFKKSPFIKQKNKFIAVVVITLALLFITYMLGFLAGFLKSSYNRTLYGIVANTLPIVLITIFSELLRYQFCKEGNKVNLFLAVVAIVSIDIAYGLSIYKLNDNFALLEFVCVVILPSISKNVVMTLYSSKYGYTITLVYCLITSTYEYMVPIIPAYDTYLNSIMLIIMPIINYQFINFYLKKREKVDTRNKGIPSKIFVTLCVLFLIFVVCLYSNLFRYWVATIASGSMSPTIEVGDIVVVDKYYQENPSNLEVGDVLVFKVRSTLYTHRIISIVQRNNNYYIRTKGDYKDNVEDSWVVTKEDIVGKVVFKIKFIGLPSVWLHNMLSSDY